MSGPALLPIPVLVELGVNLAAARYYVVASVIMLYYDVFLTFSVEVERIWMQPRSLAKGLWMFHRYYNLFIWATALWSFLYTGWTPESCGHFYLYPFLCTVPAQICIASILILRTWTLYLRNRIVLGGLIFTYMITLGLEFWPLKFGVNVPLPAPYKECILTFTSESGSSPVSLWVGMTFFDCMVFALTLGRSFYLYKQGVRCRLVELMLRDGVVYFGAIASVNIMMILTYVSAEGSLKVIQASFIHTLTVVLVSHLMLNLKSEGDNKVTIDSHNKHPSDRVVARSGGSSDAKPEQANAFSRPSISAAATGPRLPYSGDGNGYPKPPAMYSNKVNSRSWRNDVIEMQGFNDTAKNMESGFGAHLR